MKGFIVTSTIRTTVVFSIEVISINKTNHLNTKIGKGHLLVIKKTWEHIDKTTTTIDRSNAHQDKSEIEMRVIVLIINLMNIMSAAVQIFVCLLAPTTK